VNVFLLHMLGYASLMFRMVIVITISTPLFGA